MAERSCPHCGAGGLETGATGLDLCQVCGGLSRDGRRLASRQPYRNFAQPKMREMSYVQATGVVVAACMLEDGERGVAVVYRLADGSELPPIMLAGQQARDFGRLVADALAAGNRSQH